MNALWIQSSFSLFGTNLARNQQENYPTFWWFFGFVHSIYKKFKKKCHSVQKLIVIFDKLPRSFDLSILLYDIHAYKKKLKIINLSEEKKSGSWEGNWTHDSSNFSKAIGVWPKRYNPLATQTLVQECFKLENCSIFN